MQPMSDKEFDKIFQERFDEFEVNPSKPFWPSIEERLKNKKRKNDFPLFWMVAASVIIVFFAGLYILRPNHTIRLHNDDNLQAVTQPERAIPQLKEQLLIEKKVVRKKAFIKSPVESQQVREVKRPDMPAEQQAADVTDLNKMSAKIETHENHPLSQQAVIVIPNNSELKKEASPLSDSSFHTAPVVAGRTRIKSVGDLVNFVIAKVDQREDKVIEMSDNDEGTSISGINLGVLKIKSGNNKKVRGFKVNFK